MRKPLVAGNWKMHGSVQSVSDLCSGLVAQGEALGNAEVTVCPPMVFLPQVARQLESAEIALGSQNISEFEEGAYTGETSGAMLKELSCSYSIVGHSERRSLFGETDQQVAAKFTAAQKAGITPILCVGETLEQREKGEALDVIARQIQAVIELAGLQAVCDAVIAYEPVWAIGTGKTATPEQAQEVHAAIRAQLGADGQATRVLYGGSVKPENAVEIFAQPDIDGALVGGASLKADQFMAIVRAAG